MLFVLRVDASHGHTDTHLHIQTQTYTCTCTCTQLTIIVVRSYRAESILRRGSLDAFSIEESQKLSLFFASNNSITMLLKKSLEEVCVCMSCVCVYVDDIRVTYS